MNNLQVSFSNYTHRLQPSIYFYNTEKTQIIFKGDKY